MEIYTLYSVDSDSLSEANKIFQDLTKISLEPHISAFRGNYFRTSLNVPFYITLCENVDYDDEEFIDDGLAEPQFPQHKILLYLDRADLMQKEADLVDARPEIFTRLRVKIVD